MQNWISGSCLSNGDVATLSCLPGIFATAINGLFILTGTVAVIMIVLGGIKFINSGGDPKSVESANKTVKYAIIGLIVIFLSFTIIRLVGTVTGMHDTCLLSFSFFGCL